MPRKKRNDNWKKKAIELAILKKYAERVKQYLRRLCLRDGTQTQQDPKLRVIVPCDDDSDIISIEDDSCYRPPPHLHIAWDGEEENYSQNHDQ